MLGLSALALTGIHPYELSYYNALVGGPRGAWDRGLELTYWYDAFTPGVFADLNRCFPAHAQVTFLNKKTEPANPVFQTSQNLGILRSDIFLGSMGPGFPYVWLLTQDSKADPFTRVLFALRPWYASEPHQLGARGWPR